MQELSIDIETKIINDMDETIHELTGIMIWRPELIKVVDNVQRHLSSDVAYAFHILYTFAHAYHMRQRGVVSARHGTINEIWKNNVDVEKWFDPAFQEFIDKELASVRPNNNNG